jgi:hypothetical protein
VANRRSKRCTYGRAGDPSGINYWLGQLNSGALNITQIAASFSVQTESTALYSYLANPTVGGCLPRPISSATDRFIQQALLQVLQPILDPTFSEHSYGFRPGRSAHDTVLKAQSYVQSGRRIVVDVDLEKFFDRDSYCTPAYAAGTSELLPSVGTTNSSSRVPRRLTVPISCNERPSNEAAHAGSSPNPKGCGEG